MVTVFYKTVPATSMPPNSANAITFVALMRAKRVRDADILVSRDDPNVGDAALTIRRAIVLDSDLLGLIFAFSEPTEFVTEAEFLADFPGASVVLSL